MAASSLQRLRPKPVSVLGLKLRPFSLGHFLALAAEDCAYVSEQAVSPKMEDLVFGAFVCSRTWEEYHAFIESDTLEAEVKAWAETVSLAIHKSGVLVAESAKFANYLREAQEMPHYWQEGNASHPGGTHWAIAMKSCLISRLGYSRTEALNAPFAEAMADYLALAESNGSIRLWTPEEEAMAEALREQQAAQPEAAHVQ